MNIRRCAMRLRLRKLAAPVLAGVFFVSANAFADKPPVRLNVSGRFFGTSSYSANVALVARVPNHDGNREIVVSCEGLDGGVSSVSTRELEGRTGERETFDFYFNLTPAEYYCEAVLKRNVEGKIREFKAGVPIRVI